MISSVTKDIQFFVRSQWLPYGGSTGKTIILGEMPGLIECPDLIQVAPVEGEILLDRILHPVRGVSVIASAKLNADVITAAAFILLDKEDLSRGFLKTLRAIALSERNLLDPDLKDPDPYNPIVGDRRVVGAQILLGIQKMIQEDYSSWGYRYPDTFRDQAFDRCVAALIKVAKGLGNWPGL